VYQFKLDQITG